MSAVIRLIEAKDVQTYKALRLEAVRAHPEAFGGSYEEESLLDDSQWQARITGNNILLGAFTGDTLVAMAALSPEKGLKRRHIANIYSVYVKPEARQQGLMIKLMEALTARAKQAQHEILMLSVSISNTAARTLYEKLGFKTYGTEPKALKVSGQYHDEYLMYRELV